MGVETFLAAFDVRAGEHLGSLPCLCLAAGSSPVDSMLFVSAEPTVSSNLSAQPDMLNILGRMI